MPFCKVGLAMGNFAEMARHTWRAHEHAAEASWGAPGLAILEIGGCGWHHCRQVTQD